MGLYGTTGNSHLYNNACTGLPNFNAAQTISIRMQFDTIVGTEGLLTFRNNAASYGITLGKRTNRIAVWGWGGIIIVDDPTSPTSGWHHVVYTWSGSARQLFVDGQLKNTSGNSPSSGNMDEILISGWNPATNSEAWSGIIEELRVYNRVLSNEEIQELYLKHGGAMIINGLVAWFKFLEGHEGVAIPTTPNLVKDYSINGNHLTRVQDSGIAWKGSELNWSRRSA